MGSAGHSWWQVGGGAGRAWPAPWGAPTQSFVQHVPRGGICLPVWTPPSLNVAMIQSRKHSHCLSAYVCYFWHLPSIIRVLSGTDPASRPDATERGTGWPFPVARRFWVGRSGGRVPSPWMSTSAPGRPTQGAGNAPAEGTWLGSEGRGTAPPCTQRYPPAPTQGLPASPASPHEPRRKGRL